jgi:hypothetical protein
VIESSDSSKPIVDFDGRNGCDLIIRSWENVGTLPAGQIAANRSGARGNTIDWDSQGQPPGTRTE